jgi:hypothetical protein
MDPIALKAPSTCALLYALVVGVIASSSVGCRGRTPNKPIVAANTNEAFHDASFGKDVLRDAEATEPTRTSPFVLVAEGIASNGRALTLHAMAEGPPLGAYSGNVYALDDGALSMVDELARFTAPSSIDEVGTVVGRYPSGVFVELTSGIGPSGRPDFRTVLVSPTGATQQLAQAHYREAHRWKDGSLLAYRAEGTSGHRRASLIGWQGAFEVIGGAGLKPPRLPSNAGLHAFVAYESGRVLVVGDETTSGDPRPPFLLRYVWSWDGSRWSRVDLPAPETDLLVSPALWLARGRNETETLLYGKTGERKAKRPYVARFDGTNFVEVSVPFPADADVPHLSIGDDGTVWAVAVGGDSNRFTHGGVWRARFPELRPPPPYRREGPSARATFARRRAA